MADLGAINNVYRGALDADAGHGVSPQSLYAYELSIGANPNEALMLTSAAASESRLNPGAVHDGGAGYGLYGHQGSRLLAMQDYGRTNGRDIADWRTQAAFALQELRSRPEAKAVANAASPEQLALAQMHYEQPQGFTSANPEGGHNFTGRLNQLRLYTQLDPHASGSFAPSANPQIAAPASGSGAAATVASAGGSDQLGAGSPRGLPAASDGGYVPLISYLTSKGINTALGGLTNLLGGGGAGSSSGANPSLPSAAPVASLSSPSSTAGAISPAPPPPAPAAPFSAPGLPAPQQPASAAVGDASGLPLFAQGSPLSGLAGLLGGAGA